MSAFVPGQPVIYRRINPDRSVQEIEATFIEVVEWHNGPKHHICFHVAGVLLHRYVAGSSLRPKDHQA